MSDTKPTVPLNDEHMEAYQAEINRKREEMLATRPPEEVARMRIIESVSAQLEAAKVPFVLWANPVTEPNKCGFIRFNKLEYMEDATMDQRVDWMQRQAYFMLFPEMVKWVSNLFGIKTAAYYDKNDAFLFGHYLGGETAKIIEPPETK